MTRIRLIASSPSESRRRVLRIALGTGRVGLGLGLLYWVLSSSGAWSLSAKLLGTAWVLAALTALSLVAAGIEALRLKVLFAAQGVRLRLGAGYRIVCIGGFFNFCIPGGTGGDVMKLYYLASANRGRGVEVATVLLIDRAVALFSLLIVIVFLAALNAPLLQQSAVIQSLTGAAALGILALLAVAAVGRSSWIRKTGWYAYASQRLPMHGYVSRAGEALYAYRRRTATLLSAVVFSLVGHLMLAGMFLVVGTLVLPGAAGPMVCFLALLGLIANVIPITPGGLGVGEAAFERLFALAGYSGGAALLLAWRVASLPLCCLGCALYVAGVRRSPDRRSVQTVAAAPARSMGRGTETGETKAASGATVQPARA